MKFRPILFVAVLSMIVLSGCKKYENGGLVSKAEKRLSGTQWKLDKYLWNGTDQTSTLLITNYVETYNDGGAYTRSYNDSNGDPFSETGSWAFNSDKMSLDIGSVSSLPLTPQNSTVSATKYDVLRLKKDEFWYTFTNGGDTHEFRFVPN